MAPYVVDARRCISYLTIELKGFIPRELRPLIGNRIFGCDDCQDVCPWNRFAVTTPEKAFWPREGSAFPELARLALLTEQEFNTRFKDSPIRRAKRDGFVRNVVVALGNSHRTEAVPPLVCALKDASTVVRAHAAWALGQIASHQTSDLGPQTPDQRQHKVIAAIQVLSRKRAEWSTIGKSERKSNSASQASNLRPRTSSRRGFYDQSQMGCSGMREFRSEKNDPGDAGIAIGRTRGCGKPRARKGGSVPLRIQAPTGIQKL